jgi:4-amino-4-deoxy-L-arabinose transferase-like glycosyltransferase
MILLVALGLVLAARIGGRSDLDTKDQPKTVAYTADIVTHGRWVWPRDSLGNPTYKPPLYNWIGAPLVMALGWDEWVLKLPTLLAALAILGITIALARAILTPLLRRDAEAAGDVDDSAVRRLAGLGACIAGMAWIANFAVFRLIYIARPDMLVSCFVVLAFAAATLLMRQEAGRRWPLQLLLWLSVGAAALTKGPPALLPILYIPLAAWLVHGRLAVAVRTGITWGLPLAVALFALWAVPAWFTIPAGWGQRLHDIESFRMTHGGKWEWFRTAWQQPFYFTVRFLPWSPLFIAVLIFTPIRRWFRGEMGEMTLWVLLTLAFFSVPVLKRDDYILPAYPAAGIVVAWLVVCVLRKKWEPAPAAALLAGLLICAGTSANEMLSRHAPQFDYGENIKRFAEAIRKTAGPDLPRVVFVNVGYHPLETFLGVNQAAVLPDEADMKAAAWIVRPIQGDAADAVAVSGMIPNVIGNHTESRLGLYRVTRP